MYIPKKVSEFSYTFPDPNESNDEGLIAWGEDLDINRILTAYRNGIFPWFNNGDPVLWWSPNPRLVFYLDDFKVSRSLKKSINKYEVRFNTNFKEVIQSCRDIRIDKEGSWIVDDIIFQYTKLHDMKIAQSVETYFEGELIGGLYGLVIGSVFCGESMFSKKSDASKVALYHLVERLKRHKFDMIDCQIPSNHLKSLGAIEISRERFLKELKDGLNRSGEIFL